MILKNFLKNIIACLSCQQTLNKYNCFLSNVLRSMYECMSSQIV